MIRTICFTLALGVANTLAIEVEQYASVFQIEVRDNSSNAKSSIGSGFLLQQSQLYVSNYHVVSQYIAKPNNHRIVLLGGKTKELHLDIVAFDIINDIALLKPIEFDTAQDNQSTLKIAVDPPRQGDSIHAMGNPHNLGIKVVTGVYNGFVTHRFNQQILFSGSLNAGMSGGPAINQNGEVIGVNVATAGGQLSFLIPIGKVVDLLATYTNQTEYSKDNYQQRINDQIFHYQQLRYESLLATDWLAVELEQALVFREIRNDIQCWGQRSAEDDPKIRHQRYRLSCNAGDSIFVEGGLSTGQIHYSFDYYKSSELSQQQFAALLSLSNFSPDNSADKRHVTNFECNQQHISIDRQLSASVMALCVRAYKKFPDIYDVLLYSLTNHGQQGLIGHFTLAGVSKDIAMRFTEKFVKAIKWVDDE